MKQVVENAANDFDYIIINAPDFVDHPEKIIISHAANCGVIFTDCGSSAVKQATAMRISSCKLIASVQVKKS